METTQQGRTTGTVQERLAAMLSPATPEEGAPIDAMEADSEDTFEEQDGSYEPGDDEFEEAEGERLEDGDAVGFQPMTIVSDGREFVVSDRDEAIRLMQFGKTFQQRNAALIEERRALEPIKQELSSQREQYLAALPQLAQLLNSAAGPEPDPASYADRNEYLWAKDQWETQQRQLQAVKAEQQRVMSEQQQEFEARAIQWRKSQEDALYQKLPDWADKKVAAKEAQDIAEYGLAMGLTQEELGALYDHRFVLILRDAMRYRELSSSGRIKARDANKAKVAAPNLSGPATRNVKGRAQRQQRERLRQTGRVEDAAPLIAEMLGIS